VGCGTPTGTVNFYESGSPVGSATLNGSGVADLIVSNFSVGDHILSATYTGDSTYAGDSSGNHTHTVSKRNVSGVTVTSTINSSLYGQSVTFTANVASDISTKPTGEVIFKDGVTSLGTRTLDSSGQATLSTSSLTAGSHSITVEYQGDANFNTGASSALTQQVDKTDATTALTSSSSPSTYGQSVDFTATVSAVSPGGGTPDGTVTFKDDGVAIGTGVLNGSGQATLNISSLAVGSHFITAEYSGSSSYNSSISNYIIFQVNAANTSTALASSGSPSIYGQSVTFNATVSLLSGSGTPTGTVMFKDSGVPIGAGDLNGSGQASFSTSSLAVGSRSLTAEYLGDDNFNGSSSTSLAHQVDKANNATTLIASSSSSTLGQTVIFTATVTAVSPGSGTPGGIVIFKDGGVPLATVFLSG
jgi:co-chaperonin GroES (HSP10)